MSSRVETIRFLGKVETRDAAASLLSKGGDAVVVERGKPRLLILRCPCSCGDDLLINLDRRAGAAWYFHRNRTRITLFPSYWRADGCGSHFILWNNRIYWCRGWESEEGDDWEVSTKLEEKVYAALPDEWFMNYELVAEQLKLVPWEALQACRQLVNRGKAVAGKWPLRGSYRRLNEEK
jgi:hypothetical protein